MQLRTLIFTAAFAVAVAVAPIADAAECTKAQLDEIEKLEDDSAMDKACPGEDGGSGSFDFEKIDPKAWAKLSPCKDAACVTALKAQAAKVPDCEVEKVNMKTVYADKVTLCVDIASGKLSAAEIEKRIGNYTFDSFGDGAGMGSYDGDWSDSGSHYGSEVPKGTKSLTTNSTTANSTNSTPTPAPTKKKSGASTMMVASGVVFAAATLTTLTAV